MGAGIAFLAAVAYALAAIAVRRGMQAGEELAYVRHTLVVSTAIFAPIGVARVITGGVPPPAALAWFAAAGVVTMCVGRLFLFGAIRRIGPGIAGILLQLGPVITVLVAVTVLGESLPVLGWLGGVVTLGAAFLVSAGTAQPGEGPVAWRRQRPHRLPAGPRPASPGSPAPRFGGIDLAGVGRGVGAALALGVGQAMRKRGYLAAPDPFLGAAVGCLAGLLAWWAWELVVRAAASGGAVPGAGVALPGRVVASGWRWAVAGTSAVGQGAFFVALAYAPVAQVAMVAASQGVLTVLLGHAVLGGSDRLSRRTVVAAGASLCGILLIGATEG